LGFRFLGGGGAPGRVVWQEQSSWLAAPGSDRQAAAGGSQSPRPRTRSGFTRGTGRRPRRERRKAGEDGPEKEQERDCRRLRARGGRKGRGDAHEARAAAQGTEQRIQDFREAAGRGEEGLQRMPRTGRLRRRSPWTAGPHPGAGQTAGGRQRGCVFSVSFILAAFPLEEAARAKNRVRCDIHPRAGMSTLGKVLPRPTARPTRRGNWIALVDGGNYQLRPCPGPTLLPGHHSWPS